MTSSADQIDTDLLRKMYESMLLIRIFEERVAELVTEGRVKTPCHLYIGQEAIASGVCAALEKEDYVWGGHRSHGHYLAKGGQLNLMMAEIFGKGNGCSKGRGGSMHLFAREVGILGTVPLVSATIPLAVGAGLASKVRSDGRVSVAFFGDGAMEEGPFHESANFAALYKLPILFVCENNYYASHMQLLERRSLDNLAKVGEAHGMSAVSLDGNDVVAIYRAAAEGVARGRDGAGPTFLECRTYRWRGHVGPSWDMDVGVLRKDELKDWLPKDPVARARTLLLERGLPAGEFERVEAAIHSVVEDAVAFAIESSAPAEIGLLDHVYYSAGNF